MKRSFVLRRRPAALLFACCFIAGCVTLTPATYEDDPSLGEHDGSASPAPAMLRLTKKPARSPAAPAHQDVDVDATDEDVTEDETEDDAHEGSDAAP